MQPLEADLILAELRSLPPYRWTEMVEVVNRDSPPLEIMKAVMAACLLHGDEVALVGERAALDQYLAYEQARQVTTSAGANRNEHKR